VLAISAIVARLEDLYPELEDIVAACRRALPELAVPQDTFVAYLAARVPPEQTLEQWIREVNAEDLYLAFACFEGRREAIREFHKRYGDDLDRALRTSGRADARRRLDRELFVGREGVAPKIGAYSGRTSLKHWLRGVAVHLVIEVVGRRVPAVDWELAIDDDPELAFARLRYRASYKKAVRAALAELSAQERTVLAQVHVEKVPIDQLAELYNVDRANVTRWVLRAQDIVRSHTLSLLRKELGADRTSVTRLVYHQLPSSLASALAP
jgi:RNA polymerase sigma-70 factor, ECF subfamily